MSVGASSREAEAVAKGAVFKAGDAPHAVVLGQWPRAGQVPMHETRVFAGVTKSWNSDSGSALDCLGAP